MSNFVQAQCVRFYQRLTDEDIPRVALKMKSILKEETEQLVQGKVDILAGRVVDPIKKELEDVTRSCIRCDDVKNEDFEKYTCRSCLRISGSWPKWLKVIMWIVLRLSCI